MAQQFIHGTQYIDELVMMRRKDKGDLYVHQDANWNVIGVSDLGGRLVEKGDVLICDMQMAPRSWPSAATTPSSSGPRSAKPKFPARFVA